MKEISVKLGIVVLVGIIFLSMNYYQVKEEVIQGKKEEAVKVAVTIDDNVNYVDLDDYLLGVVAGEMPANFELEALKAQVVASRTFVYNRNLSVDNTVNSQVYLSEDEMKKNWGDKYNEYHQKISEAIKETDNEVMKYQGEYISALFFSSSNGYTENVEDYFESSPLPYLRSVDSHWDLTIDPKNTRQTTFTKQELKEKYSGRQVREILGLSSSCFTIEYVNNNYVFTTKGSGHGVGMSQYGAQGMALEGSNYKEILNHYYTGIEIVNN